MRHLQLLAGLLLFSAYSAAAEVTVKYATPSKIVAKLAGLDANDVFRQGEPRLGQFTGNGKGLIPTGAKLLAKDSLGILVVEGSDEQVAEITRYIKLFDVKPLQVELAMEVECPTKHYRAKSLTMLSNNRLWKTSDTTLDSEFSVAARVNDDGTVTLFFAVGQGDHRRDIVLRSKSGDSAYITIGQEIQYSVGKEIALEKSAARDDDGANLDVPPFRIKLSFKILPASDAEKQPTRRA